MPNRDQRRRDGTFEYAQLDLAPDEPARCEHDFHAFLGNQRIGRSASPDGWRYGPCPAASGTPDGGQR